MVEREPEWLDEDIDAALEYIEYEQSLCSGCSRPRSETFAEEADGRYVAEPLTCHACAARDAESRRASEARQSGNWGEGSFDGVYFAITEKAGD